MVANIFPRVSVYDMWEDCLTEDFQIRDSDFMFPGDG
jgi:hypothetical protein